MSIAVGAAVAAALIGTGLALLYVSKLLLEWALRMDVDQALFVENNLAIGLAAAGYYLGVTLVLSAAIGTGQVASPLANVGLSLLYGCVGVGLQALSLRFTPRLLLPCLDPATDLAANRNAGAGLVLGMSAVASGAIVAAAMQGEAPGGLAGGLLSMTTAFCVGQLSAALLVRMHRLVAHFDVHAEIRAGNHAASCTLAGAQLGNAVLLYWGLKGDFAIERWQASLASAGAAFGLGILLMPAVRLLVSRLFFARIGFDLEIATDRNMAAGVLELVAHPALALLLVSALP